MERLPEFIANHLFLFCLFIALLTLLLWDLFRDKLMGVNMLQVSEAVRMLNHESAKIVDLRVKAEFEEGHIIDALNIEIGDVAKLNEYQQDKIILYCGNGVNSARVGQRLRNQGFSQIYCLQGGVASWLQADMPLIRS